MHKRYGVCDGKICGDCCNMIEGKYHDKTYRKCVAYGLSHSFATDWARSWQACGRFDVEFDESRQKPLMDTLKHEARKSFAPADGQMSLL